MWGKGDDDPFRDFENFIRRMSHIGSSVAGSSSFSRTTGSGGTFESVARGSFSPATSITDTGSQYIVELDVPGIAKEDLKVTATAQKLCIAGQRRAVHEALGGGTPQNPGEGGQQQGGSGGTGGQFGPYGGAAFGFGGQLLDERAMGFFERCFTFPNRVNESDVSAQFNSGVLAVSVGHTGAGSDPSKEINIR